MKRLALYLRLSLEDEGEKDESNSISNQRKLIYEYIHHDSELSGMRLWSLVMMASPALI